MKTTKCFYTQHLFDLEDGSTVRLPPFEEPTENEKFLDLYKALDKILHLQRNERYFEQEMVEYRKITNSTSALKSWVAKNEDLGAKKYVCFLIDYLDNVENDREEHLNIYISSSKELEIFIDQQDFKNTIDFLEIFNEL